MVFLGEVTICLPPFLGEVTICLPPPTHPLEENDQMVVLGKTTVHFTPFHPTGKMIKFDTNFSPACSEGLHHRGLFYERSTRERTLLQSMYSMQ